MMTVLPIVARELRVAARRRGTYWSRVMMAVAAIIIGVVLYFSFAEVTSRELGVRLFYFVAGLAFLYCLATGIRSTADCLSEEKREGTLGLLFLTDLNGFDVVAGKLVATSLNAFYGLLAILPVLAIPLLMGGVTRGEFWRMALVLVNTFFFSLSIGMFVSAISRHPRKSVSATVLVILFFAAGLPLLAEVQVVAGSRLLRAGCAILTPWSPMLLIEEAEYLKAAKYFWWSVGVIHGLAWLMLGLASVIVPRSWQDKPPGPKGARWRERWHQWSYGDPAERHAFRKRLLDANAVFWLAGRARLKPAHVWVALAVVACLWSWGAVAQRGAWLNDFVYAVTALVLNFMLKIWVASEAGRQFGQDRKIGALELILSTPITVREIVRGQMLALYRQFLGPLVTVLVIECIFLAAMVHSNRTDSEGLPIYLAVGIGILITLVTDLLALSAVSMWVSLTAKNPNRAPAIAMTRILVLPMVISLALFIGLMLFARFDSGVESAPKILLLIWLGPKLAISAYFGFRAWYRLHNEFREVAAQRYTPRQPRSRWFQRAATATVDHSAANTP
jgi:ABC-type transport system involved in cytochrome c biogenesis permease component